MKFQKVLDIEFKDINNLDYKNYFMSQKLDGVFVCAHKKEDNTVVMLSSSGKQYVSLKHLEESMSTILKPLESIIFEAYVPNVEQSVISGLVRNTKQQALIIQAWCHTLITKDNTEPYSETIHELWSRIVDKEPYGVFIVPQMRINNIYEVSSFYNEVVSIDGEGLILRDIRVPYLHGKRNKSMVKIKKTFTVDIPVIGVLEGKGKYTGTTGALVCKFYGKELTISGFSDELRRTWWDNPELIVGKIVEVETMRVTSGGSLREPRFKRVRYDKDE